MKADFIPKMCEWHQVYLFQKGLEGKGTPPLHLSIDMSTELRHDLKQHSVMVHKAAAELGRMSGQ